jgi:hypothetical protein
VLKWLSSLLFRRKAEMPSIFIWKSKFSNDSKQTIRYYSGSNWFLEDTDESRSYKFLEQIVIPGLNDSVIIFNTRKMPHDWVGSDLLEVTQLPYKKIKEDKYGCLEQVGDWMRFISKSEINFDVKTLEMEYTNIMRWTNITEYSTRLLPKQEYQQKAPRISPFPNTDLNHIRQEFNKFLIKYTIPNI